RASESYASSQPPAPAQRLSLWALAHKSAPRISPKAVRGLPMWLIASRAGRTPGISPFSGASARAWPITPAKPCRCMPRRNATQRNADHSTPYQEEFATMSPSVVNRPLGITMGDANGIGPEIIAKLFAQGLPHPALVYGDAGVMQATIEALGLQQIGRASCRERGQ